MKFLKAVPILYSKNVSKSIAYFIEKLKFENKWEWGSEASFGGVYRDDVEIFFCKDDQGHPGTWLSLMVENVDEYYESIKERCWWNAPMGIFCVLDITRIVTEE